MDQFSHDAGEFGTFCRRPVAYRLLPFLIILAQFSHPCPKVQVEEPQKVIHESSLVQCPKINNGPLCYRRQGLVSLSVCWRKLLCERQILCQGQDWTSNRAKGSALQPVKITNQTSAAREVLPFSQEKDSESVLCRLS